MIAQAMKQREGTAPNRATVPVADLKGGTDV